LVCRSVSYYEGVNIDVIRDMKYASHKSVALMMGEIMARLTQKPDVDFLVPIPLHKGSDRGYNQAELIARGVSGVWGIPVKDCIRWEVGVSRQASTLDRASRKLVGDVMSTVGEVRQMTVFLVDDVCTTGNTLMAASRALAASGVMTSGAMVWSRSA
jgi:predicted amidophosphoribosyltransferase